SYEIVAGDIGYNYQSNGHVSNFNIEVYRYDPTTLSQVGTAIQKITPYLSTVPANATFESFWGPGVTHTYRLWADDLNHDGKPDILAGESMWSGGPSNYPSALQVLINNGDGTFADKTHALNPDMSQTVDELDYNPSILDVDHSGINSFMFGKESPGGDARQSNYLILNDGTGRLYVALHDQFDALNVQVDNFLATKFPGQTFNFAKFIAVPQADGAIDYVAEVQVGTRDASGLIHVGYELVNVPLHYNPTTDFTTSVTISDRNGSSLMRTWAGADTVFDTNAGANAHIDGGLGVNTAVYSGRMSDYQITRNLDGTVLVSNVSATAAPKVNDTLTDFQVLKFADQQVDLMRGGAGNDTIVGGAGADTVSGGDGANYLRGGAGDDSIQGGSDFDDINGNKGQDTIDGGTGGHDWLVGGQGDDL
ncbi:MAG: VCBS repeat-containing protein, partial [Proteobacteria bacterium]|nr:VCBS repeat-containing protein [Pseudomonadota bacterium]